MTISIVPAAGQGIRLRPSLPNDQPLPKALVPLFGKPILCWCLQALEKTPVVDAIVIVVPKNAIAKFYQLAEAENWGKLLAIVAGGNDRQQSVWNGIQAIPPETDWVIIHDAARPLVTPELIISVWETAQETRAAIAALPCFDTVKRSLNGVLITETLERRQLWLAQTPQAFAADLLRMAHEKAIADSFTATDDAMLVERLGVPVRIVEGDPTNLKVTNPIDLLIAEALLRSRMSLSKSESQTFG